MAAQTQQESQPTLQTIPIDEIERPSHTEKLHPVEEEDDEDWAGFKETVGTQPDKEIEVRQNGSAYELIDGDRRLRAVEENGGDEIRAKVFPDLPDDEFYLRRLRANLNRKDNDPKKQSWYTAQYVAPWLLPPGERWHDEQQMDQYEYARHVGYTQPTVSNWLKPMKNAHPIRSVLGEESLTGNSAPDKEQIGLIDDVVDWLRGRREHDRVIPRNQIGKAADEIGDMSGPSFTLNNVHSAAKKAAENGWKMNQLLEELGHYNDTGTSPAGGSIDMGMRNTDSTPEETHDGDPDRMPSDPPEQTDEQPSDDSQEFIDWTDHVGDDQLEGLTTSLLVGKRRKERIIVNGDVAVALHAIKESSKTDYETLDDAMREFFGPMIVDEAIDHFAE